MLQTFHGSPLSAVMVGTAGVLTLATSGTGMLASLPLAGIPPLAWFPSSSTAICVVTVLMQCRHWERRKGSGRYLMLWVLPILALVAVAAAAPSLLAAAPNAASARRAAAAGVLPVWRLTTDVAWAAVSACLAVRYLSDVPACKPGAHRLEDKWPTLLALVKLVIADSILGLSRSRPHAVVIAALIGAGCGFLAGLAPVRTSRVMSGLDGWGPFESLLRAISAVVAGGDVQRRVALPTPPVQDPAGGPLPPGGPVMRGMVGDGMGRLPRPVGRVPRPAATAGAQQQPQQPQQQQLPPQDPASVQLLMGLGLGCSQQEAEQALHLASGNVDAAAALLMDRH